MARKTREYLATHGRDNGKKFLITEMSSYDAEKWATRAFLALAKSGVQVPPEVQNLGFVGFLGLGLQSLVGINTYEAIALSEELFKCVKVIEPVMVRDLIDRMGDNDDIEEVQTRAVLKGEILALHAGFTLADLTSKFRSESTSQTQEPSPNTPTSQSASHRSRHPVRHR